MNREIKVRGLNKEGEWVYGQHYHDQQFINGHSCVDVYLIRDDCDGDHLVDEKSITQYACSKDENGIEIYSGDILRVTSNDDFDFENKEVSEHSILTEVSGFDVINIYGQDFDMTTIDWAENWGFILEVIGNIHQNPELLN